MARLLEEVDVRAGADFSGVGIIVADSFDSLPLINLRPTNSLLEDAETATARSEEHTSELQSLMRISYAVFCLKKNIIKKNTNNIYQHTTHYYMDKCSVS